MAEFHAIRSDCEHMLHLRARTFAPLTKKAAKAVLNPWLIVWLQFDPDQWLQKTCRLNGNGSAGLLAGWGSRGFILFPIRPDVSLDIAQNWTRAKEFGVMYRCRRLIGALAVLSLLAAVPLLSACHTTAGAGQDISATGKAIEKSADKHTP